MNLRNLAIWGVILLVLLGLFTVMQGSQMTGGAAKPPTYSELLTMADKRNQISRQIEWDVRGHFGDLVYNTIIPRNVRVSEAPSHGKPAIVYDLNCVGSRAYIKLASELIRQEKLLVKATEEAA